MAGIYIHIPFCRQKCHYCDFYKSTNVKLKPLFLQALKEELAQRRDYLNKAVIKTIYFGGGTPSVLSIQEIEKILTDMAQIYTIDERPEITFEANPDDLSLEYLSELKTTGVNRLSIGIQSFNDDILQIMNRRHNARQAFNAVEMAFQAGFSNLSTDLIYGIPNLTENQLKQDLQIMFQLPIMHISAYHLTYHRNTTFYNWLKKGTLQELDEEESINQYKILIEATQKAGFEQYEISNFAKEQCYSQHNVGYWKDEKYLGVGASAHSYDGKSRQWNIADVEKYIRLVKKQDTYFECEDLSKTDRFNEYIITNIRTKWGISINFIQKEFGGKICKKIENQLNNLCEHKLGFFNDDNFILTQKGLFISDEIMGNLMV